MKKILTFVENVMATRHPEEGIARLEGVANAVCFKLVPSSFETAFSKPPQDEGGGFRDEGFAEDPSSGLWPPSPSGGEGRGCGGVLLFTAL